MCVCVCVCVCVCIFLMIKLGYGLGEDHYRNKVPFSLHHIKDIYYQPDVNLNHVVACLSGFFAESFSPSPIPYHLFWKKVTK